MSLLIDLFLCSVIELARKRLQFIFSQSAYFFEKSDFNFEGAHAERNLKFQELLIDVSKYDDPRLLQESLHLLNRYIYTCCQSSLAGVTT